MSIETDRDLVVQTILHSAATARESARYAGRMDDGGASRIESQLNTWLDGIEFAKTGNTGMYGYILEQARKEQDSEYQEYLRLKEKFK